MAASLTRTIRFRATHRLYRDDWPADENRRRFGWTTEPHTHDYACRVTVAGPVDDRAPMVMDLALLDRLLADVVVRRLDGKALPDDLTEFRAVLPTCEAIARDVFRRLGPRLPEGVRLVKVRIEEDPSLSAEWTDDA
jgi:6-pyruvoyltetrahydropterin/6-carboxytetrahydropterin synthase